MNGDERHCLSYVIHPANNGTVLKTYDVLAINSYSSASKAMISSNIYFNNVDTHEPAKFQYLSLLGLLFIHLVWIPQSIGVRKHVVVNVFCK